MTITCIIPFFNERDRIVKVLDEVVKIKDINQILVVDDGSTDGTAEQVKQYYSNIAILHNKKNLGKTEAITTGLNHAKSEYILLLDADLQRLNHQELEKGLDVIRKDTSVDMIILKRIDPPLIVKLSRGAILISGQRLIKKGDLLLALDLYKPRGYELEFALNQYMMDKQKQVYWMPLSVSNTRSTRKLGYGKGMQKIIQMHKDIFQYLGLSKTLKQFLFFCKEEYRIT